MQGEALPHEVSSTPKKMCVARDGACCAQFKANDGYPQGRNEIEDRSTLPE